MTLRQLAAARPRQLHQLLERGEPPNLAALAGWEYRGVNMPPPLPTLLGIRRFLKGFLGERNGRFLGYNKQVVGNDLELPWTPRPQRDGQERYAFFAVSRVDPSGTENRYRNAVLFDYGAAPDPERGIGRSPP